MARTPYDHFAKTLVIARGALLGRAVPDHAVAAETQHADLWWTPASSLPAPRDALDRMLADEAMFEFFHQTPDTEEFFACVGKLLAWFSERCNAARAAKKKPPTLPPPLWIVSSGAPLAVLSVFPMLAMEGWPTGLFAGPPGSCVRLVIVSALPREPSTLLLRLMGTGVTLREAAAELAALPPAAPERATAGPLFARLRRSVIALPSLDDEVPDMDYEKLFAEADERFTRAARDEGQRRGIAPLLHQFTRRLGRPITDDEHRAIATRLDTVGPDRLGDVVLDLDAPALAAWLADPDAR